jgi:hypothetical protein
MKRLRSWLINILVGVSLLLCTATCVLWVRSQWVQDSVGRDMTNGHGDCVFEIDVSSLSVGPFVSIFKFKTPVRLRDIRALAYDKSNALSAWASDPRRTYSYSRPQPWPSTQWVGLQGTRSESGSGILYPGMEYEYFVPWYLIALGTGIPAIAFIAIRLRRSSRPVAGVCNRCGYDLRATPDRCPECGSIRHNGEKISA